MDGSGHPGRFLVTCPARTGSTMLVWFLQSHPNLCTHGEVLAPTGPLNIYGVDYRFRPPLDEVLRRIRERDPVAFVRDVVWQAGERRAAGFKAKYEELLLPEYAGVLGYIERERDVRVIHLWRENLLERYLSQYLAVNVYGLYNVVQGTDRPAERAVRLSPEECRADFERTERRRARFRAGLAEHPVLDMSYEELVGSTESVLARVQDFLGVEERPLQTRSQKLRTRSLRETITNYEELADAFRETPYARFFTE
jgi:LPS sulfotransferase NodH